MNTAVRIPSLAAAAALAVALVLTGCAPADEPVDAGPNPTETEPATETSTPDAADADTDSDSGDAGQGDTSPSNAPPAPDPQGDDEGDDEPTTAPAPPPAATPAVSVLTQQCTSGKLKVTLTASYNTSYRKGINSVVLERQNEYDAWLDADATWLGPETGQGNQWTGNPPGHKNQDFQDDLRITVTAAGGAETVLTVPITANC